MLKKVYVVVNVISGFVDTVEVFSQGIDADKRHRELIFGNSPFTDAELDETYGPRKASEVCHYLYDSDANLYYPISTWDHDVYLHETIIDGE